jgi:hypothetical protein
VGEQRGHALGGGEAEKRSVRRDRSSGRAVGDAGDRVDDPVAPVVDGDLQAGLGAAGDQLVQEVWTWR